MQVIIKWINITFKLLNILKLLNIKVQNLTAMAGAMQKGVRTQVLENDVYYKRKQIQNKTHEGENIT